MSSDTPKSTQTTDVWEDGERKEDEEERKEEVTDMAFIGDHGMGQIVYEVAWHPRARPSFA